MSDLIPVAGAIVIVVVCAVVLMATLDYAIRNKVRVVSTMGGGLMTSLGPKEQEEAAMRRAAWAWKGAIAAAWGAIVLVPPVVLWSLLR